MPSIAVTETDNLENCYPCGRWDEDDDDDDDDNDSVVVVAVGVVKRKVV